MKITYEIDFETYETRKSAQALLRRINAEGKANQLDAMLTDLYYSRVFRNRYNLN